MHKYFDVELFGWQRIDETWWNLTFFRIAGGNWSWHFFMIEESYDRLFIQWFTFNRTNG